MDDTEIWYHIQRKTIPGDLRRSPAIWQVIRVDGCAGFCADLMFGQAGAGRYMRNMNARHHIDNKRF
ncbi:hypothetical protein [Komagataeibacter diospyri]|uniref:hypothetical protein n=1 Tax=Komagataeibacter diospyri TaxID=1932662 RepID=UPI0037566F5F